MLFWLKKEVGQLVDLLEIKPGIQLVDLGAGIGDFTIPLAKVVGQNGKIYAVEFDSDKLRKLEKKIKDYNLNNVTTVRSSQTSTNLPELSADVIFIREAYHHFSHPREINSSILKSLKPGGKLAVIDFAPKFFLTLFSPLPEVPKNRGGHGIKKEIVTEELASAGFKLVKQIDKWNWYRYCLLFQKP